MMKILQYLLDPQPRRGWRIVLAGMIIFVVFIYAQGFCVEKGYISESQGEIFYWLAISGWLLGVIGVVNHFRWFFNSKSSTTADKQKQPWQSGDDN